MDQIEINNKNYISAKRAAELNGYTTDYVGQLCRSDKVEAVRIGRSWYVGERSIALYKSGLPQDQDVVNEANTSAETDISTPEESVKAYNVRSFHSQNEGAASYEQDDSPLLPKLYRYSKQLEIGKYLEPPVVDDVTEHVFGKNRAGQSNSLMALFKMGKIAMSAAAFVLIVGLMFTVNPDYMATSLYQGVNATASAVSEIELGSSTVSDLLRPLNVSARELSTLVDNSVYDYLYGEVLPRSN